MTAHRTAVLLFCCCLVGCLQCAPPAHAQARILAPIATNVELVQVPVVVFDEKGALANNLRKEDFRLTDDGVVQQIQYFDRVRTPVSFVILADVSSSMTRKIPFVQQAALALLQSPEAQRETDEYSVVSIGTHAHRLVHFTHDQQDLAERLPLLLSATKDSTALFDGIYLGVSTARREAANARRAMIIISDGGDNHSIYNLRETRDLLEEADVPVFAVMAGTSYELLPDIFASGEKKKRPGLGGPQLPIITLPSQDKDYIGPAERRGPGNLRTLTEVTGGGVFTAQHDDDIARIVRTIGEAVRYEYVLSYKPVHAPEAAARRLTSKGTTDKGAHKIHLELYPKDKFKGYSMPYYRRAYHSLNLGD